MLRKTVVVILAFMTIAAADARATLRFDNHNDPAGDPTVINYRLTSPTWSGSPFDFALTDGDYRSFGVPAGVYTAQALLPAGWVVGDIDCVGPRPEDFAKDIPSGRVTVTHGAKDEHLCTFTNRKAPQGGGGQPPSPGVSPSPPPAQLPKVVLPRRPALLGVSAGRGYAEASLRIMRRSEIKGRLLRHAKRLVGAARIVRKAGTHTIRVPLERERMRRMRRRGMENVTLTLRIVVTARRSGVTHAFRHRVIVDL
jgi:hypothetical protein